MHADLFSRSPQAHDAFSLAIKRAEPADEVYIFYSNRSLCSLNLDKPEDAEADARKVPEWPILSACHHVGSTRSLRFDSAQF
eukprot:scaffold41566_cov34-Tisochrysis_lutea.AAC.1